MPQGKPGSKPRKPSKQKTELALLEETLGDVSEEATNLIRAGCSADEAKFVILLGVVGNRSKVARMLGKHVSFGANALKKPAVAEYLKSVGETMAVAAMPVVVKTLVDRIERRGLDAKDLAALAKALKDYMPSDPVQHVHTLEDGGSLSELREEITDLTRQLGLSGKVIDGEVEIIEDGTDRNEDD